MKPYYEHAGITIYHGDCREILPQLEQTNLVLTDPPYGVGFNYGNGYKDSRAGYGEFLGTWLGMAESLTDRCAVFQSARNVTWWSLWFSPRAYRLIAIPKLFAQWNVGSDVQWSTDYVLYWRPGDESAGPKQAEGKEHAPEHTSRDFFVSSDVCRVGLRPDHPCPRPMDAMRFLVDTLSQVGQSVLDPFMGSGTTLNAGINTVKAEYSEDELAETTHKGQSDGILARKRLRARETYHS